MALTQDTRSTMRWTATPSSGELACLSFVGAVTFFGGWQLIAVSGLVSQYVLPSPLAVLEQIYQLEAEPFAGFLLHQRCCRASSDFCSGSCSRRRSAFRSA
jgi:ABC-type nitrate/sulfonate/bicarbonate transport system permease component